MSIPLFSLIFLILAATFSAADDSAAMAELRTSLTPTPSGWTAQSDYCHWAGVECDGSRSVTVIDLASLSLSGSLHAVRNMTKLVTLRLADNRFSGRLPDFSGCSALANLNLRGNSFTGQVVLTAFPPALRILSVDGNSLQGPLPEFAPRRVEALFSNNSFCKDTPGPCDPQVTILLGVAEGFGYPLALAVAWKGNNACHWEGLIGCDQSGNVVTITLDNLNLGVGIISPELGDLRHLRYLTLKSNGLTGYIPDRLLALPELQVLDVSGNNLFGQVPAFRSGVVVSTEGNTFIRTAAEPPPAPPPSPSPAPSRPGAGCWGTSMVVGMFFGLVVGVSLVVIMGLIMVRIVDRGVGGG